MTLSDDTRAIMESDTERLLGQILARLNTLELTVGEIKRDQREIRQELAQVYGNIKSNYVTVEAFEPVQEMRATINRLAFAVILSIVVALVSLVIK